MADRTGIAWTDATWNPVRGCSRVSEGCRNCYAEAVAARFCGPGQPYEGLALPGGERFRTSSGENHRVGSGPRWTGEVRFIPEQLDLPLRWTKPRRVFVNSMSDLFHEKLTDEQIAAVFGVMAAAPQHTFQVLTKRPERMRAWFAWARTFTWQQRGLACAPNTPRAMIDAAFTVGGETPERKRRLDVMWHALDDGTWPLPNVWLGVSIENQETADERIPLLLGTPAAVRFVSAEPLIGPVDLSRIAWGNGDFCDTLRRDSYRSGLDSERLDWIICGGESGPGARPMRPSWARAIRAQCAEANVPFFFKQWGEWAPGENVQRTSGVVDTATLIDGAWVFGGENLARADGHRDDEPDLYRIGKRAAGELLDGERIQQFPDESATEAAA